MTHVYIAHSTRDNRIVAEMREQLLRAGFRPWLDPAPRPGQDWRFDIDDAIRAADCVVLILTAASADSVYVTYEWTLALASGIPVIPVMFQRDISIHPRLRTLDLFDSSGWKDINQFWDYFLREMSRRFAKNSPEAAAPSTRPPGSINTTDLAGVPEPPSAQRPQYDRSVMPSEAGFWVVIRRGPQLNSMFRLQQDTVSLGRDGTNDIAINDPEVSRHHLRFVWRNGGFAVEDLGSTNGSSVDGLRITSLTPLQAGASITLGESIILSYAVIA